MPPLASPPMTGAAQQVRPRPRWLRALGSEGPPQRLEIAAVPYRLREVFKHDSWAATALYEAPSGALRVVKLHRQAAALGLPLAWLGRRLARHETRLLQRLSDLPGIPPLDAPPAGEDGRPLANGVARDYILGAPLGHRQPVGDRFFPALDDLLRRLHDRGVLYIDLHKRENIVVSDRGEPFLIDFQISLIWPRWLPRGPLFQILRRSDLYHLTKHWARCRPDQWSGEGRPAAPPIPWWIHAHRLIARPVREFRRRLLVRLGVRAGQGRVETEHFAEHALRPDLPAAGENQAA